MKCTIEEGGILSDEESKKAIVAALAARAHAVIKCDVEYLESILAPEFRHVHATGLVERRDVWLAAARKDRGFTVIEAQNLDIDIYGDAAVAAGDIYIERDRDGSGTLSGRTSRFGSAWRKGQGGWKLAYWQMTRKSDGVE